MIDIDEIKRKLLVKYPFFGTIITNVKFIEVNEEKTASTDGVNIFYNSSFVKNLSMSKRIFLFAHEICHIAFDHIDRRKDKDNEIWNIAADAIINAFLINDGLEPVEKCIQIKDAVLYDVETLYERLKNDPSIKNKKFKGHASHSNWGKNNKKNNIDNNDELSKSVKEISKMGEKDVFNKNKNLKKEILNNMKNNLNKQASILAGNSMGSSFSTIKDIGSASNLINWRMLLREATRANIDWSYKNATIEYGVITPHLEYEPFCETEIVLDTSGTVDDELLKIFLRECKNILNYSKIKVGCFDTKFYGFQEIRNDEDIDNMKFVGRGGTNFDVAVNAFTSRVENKIIFTDGYAEVPKKPVNAIWIVFGSKKINPKGGKVIYIDPYELKRRSKQSLILRR